MSDQKRSTLQTKLENADKELHGIEQIIIETVKRNLEQRVNGAWTESDDAIFGVHTGYVAHSIRYHLHLRPALLWIKYLWPLTEAAEQQLGALIHKGAPFYNTGLCFFLAGDALRAAQFLDAAGDEDERRNPGSARHLITGGGMAEQLIRPLYNWLINYSNSDYSSVTTRALSDQEIRDIINYLAMKTANAVLLISALQRIVLYDDRPDVYALHLHKVRALSDLILVYESNLRGWQQQSGQLARRSSELLRPNQIAFAYFHLIDRSYPAYDWEDPNNINDFIANEIQRFDNAVISAEKAAIAVYTTYRLRNSLMHIIEDRLIIFGDQYKLARLINFAIISITLSKYGFDSRINTI